MSNIEVNYEFSLNDRMRSISTNAVQEARVAKGRGTMPFLDKDSRIQNMIERLLHELTEASETDLSTEHFPLVEKEQPLIGKHIDDMSEILDKISNEVRDEIDEVAKEFKKPLVNASLPKSKA